MTDRGPNVQPGPFILDHPEEIQRHDIADGHDDHKERGWLESEAEVEDAEIGGDDGEWDHELEEEEGALGEGVEDRDEAVDSVEGEGGDGGDVAGGEEGRLEEEEEE